ncbi:MAG: hypothetical protein ACYTG2_06565 [Planctomycetota bacterium]
MEERSLSSEERELLQAAVALHAPLARAARLGAANGLGYAIFGVLTLLFSVFGLDLVGLALGAVLLTVGILERRGAASLRHADPAAPGLLARNELVLMGAIVLYATLRLTILRDDSAALEQQLGDTSALGIDVGELMESMNTMVFATVAAVALLYQGGMARYFLLRRPMLDEYVSTCPDWAREVVEGLGA